MDGSRYILVLSAGRHQQGCGEQNYEASHEPSVSIVDERALRRVPIAGLTPGAWQDCIGR